MPRWVDPKDPAEIVNQSIDWSYRLGDDQIVASAWEVKSGGIAIVSQAFDQRSATVKISGGTVGQKAVLTNQITTRDGIKLEQSIVMRIVDK